MLVEKRTREGCTILTLKGKLTFAGGDEDLRVAVLKNLGHPAPRILLDLSQLTAIDSAGLGQLVSTYTTIGNRGGRLMLLSPTPQLLNVLEATQLITVFDVYEDEDEAVAS